MKEKSELVKDISEEFYTHINIEKVHSGDDVYKILLEHYGLQFSSQITELVTNATIPNAKLENTCHAFSMRFIKMLSDTYSYTRYLYTTNENNKKDDNEKNNDKYSHSDTDDDNGGDDGDDGDDENNNNEKPSDNSSTKRPRDDGEENNANDNNNGTSNPKKRRNE